MPSSEECKEILSKIKETRDSLSSSISDVRSQVDGMRRDNREDHQQLFGRLRDVEIKQANQNGRMHHHTREGDDKDGPILRRKGEVIKGIPTQWFLLVILAALAGERVIHWVGMFFGILGQGPH